MIVLPSRGVRWIGVGLVMVGVLLPAAGMWLREMRSSGPVALRPAMMKLPPGTFMMGAEKGKGGGKVDITLSFALSVTEVTQEQYLRVMGENRSSFEGEADLPVENVSWLDAVTYCNRLSKLEGLPECYRIKWEDAEWTDLFKCKGYRLPTEAEWEYAARAGEPTEYSGGDDADKVGWFYKNSNGKTHPVAGKLANSWGLHDMSGNIWEWVWDWYELRTGLQGKLDKDPVGPKRGSERVLRGGSWSSIAADLRVSDRFWYEPAHRRGDIGFRLSRSL